MSQKRSLSKFASEKTTSVHDARRARTVDRVFDSLSRAILTGELPEGATLPTQRELALQFGVSLLVMRHALHRLEELGLVNTRQGSASVVLDPRAATDIRVMQLQLELAQPGDQLTLAAIEQRALFPITVLALAERRITPGELRALEELLGSRAELPTLEQALSFRFEFWKRLAASTHNPIIQHQVRWWWRLVRELSQRQEDRRLAPSWAIDLDSPSPTLYRDLIEALRRRTGAVAVWQRALEQVCQNTEAQPTHPMHEHARRSEARES